jgi:putative methyltransferase (TIGR04325 family)
MRPLLRALVPPLIANAYRALAPRPRRFFGVFKSFDELPARDPWTSAGWLAAQDRELAAVRGSRRLPPDALIPCLVVDLLAVRGPCRVLDFAGGSGITYFTIRPFLANAVAVSWHVVDNAQIAAVGRRYRRPDDAIEFSKELPAEGTPFDVVHVNTALQYLEDPFALLERLCAHRPRYFLLTRLLAGEVEPFITSQSIPDSGSDVRVPCRFFNAGEVVAFFAERGYRLAHRSRVVDGDFSEWFDDSVPVELRTPSAIHLVLAGPGV